MGLKWKPRNLEEVMKEVEEIEKEIKEKGKRPIDPKVRDLVIGLRRWEITTKMSCQGHPGRFPFPWISVSFKDVEKLHKICGWYNTQKNSAEKINWVILPMTFPSGITSIRLVPAERNLPLEKLQESAIDFGKFLQELPELPMNL